MWCSRPVATNPQQEMRREPAAFTYRIETYEDPDVLRAAGWESRAWYPFSHGVLSPRTQWCLGDEWKLSFLHSGHPPLHYSQPSQIILLIKIGEYSCVLACTPMVLVTLGKLIIPPTISFSETCTGGADQGRENNNSWNASSRVLTRQPRLTMKSISVNKKTVLRWLSTHASTRRTPMTSKQILP